MKTNQQAIFARTHQGVTFRVGQPVKDYHAAYDRWWRLDNKGPGVIRYLRRKYTVKFYEVRAVDHHGRGLGREDHFNAIPIPYRSHKVR